MEASNQKILARIEQLKIQRKRAQEFKQKEAIRQQLQKVNAILFVKCSTSSNIFESYIHPLWPLIKPELTISPESLNFKRHVLVVLSHVQTLHIPTSMLLEQSVPQSCHEPISRKQITSWPLKSIFSKGQSHRSWMFVELADIIVKKANNKNSCKSFILNQIYKRC